MHQHTTIMKKIARIANVVQCTAVSQLIVKSQRLSSIQVLNCQCLKGHKFHILFVAVIVLVFVIIFMLVRSCLLIIKNKRLKGHKYQGSLFECVFPNILSLSCPKLSKIVKWSNIVKNVQNDKNFLKIKNCQTLSTFLKLLARSFVLIILIKCLKVQMTLGLLFMFQNHVKVTLLTH